MNELEFISNDQFEDNIHDKYGYGIASTLKIATGDTAMTDGSEYLKYPTITLNDLDELFTIDEDFDMNEDYDAIQKEINRLENEKFEKIKLYQNIIKNLNIN